MSIDIKTSRAVCDAAYEPDWVDRYGEVCVVRGGIQHRIGVFDDPANARLAAHSRMALPAALDEIERLRAELQSERDKWRIENLKPREWNPHVDLTDSGGEG